jgi:hypothetical protein
LESPAWLAEIAQVPAARRVTVAVAIVHLVVSTEVKETVSPEELVAEMVKVPIPKVLSESEANVMVWVALFTVTVLVVVAVS